MNDYNANPGTRGNPKFKDQRPVRDVFVRLKLRTNASMVDLRNIIIWQGAMKADSMIDLLPVTVLEASSSLKEENSDAL